MRVPSLASLLMAFVAFTSLCVVSAEVEPTLRLVQSFSAKNYTLGGARAVNITSTVGSKNSRSLLAELFSNTLNIEAGQVYAVYFTGHSCVKFSVTSSPEDLHVMLMAENNYLVFKANSYSGSYLYIEGSKCEQTYSCAKTIDGLSRFATYYLVVINDYDGVFGGDDATTEVLVETCSSSPSPSSSGSSSSGSSSSGSSSSGSSSSGTSSTSYAPRSFTSCIPVMLASVALAVFY